MLYNKDLYDSIKGGKGKSSDKYDVEWKKLNRKIIAIIRQLLDLIRKLINMKYKNGQSKAEHMSVFQNTVNQLTANDIKLDDEL